MTTKITSDVITDSAVTTAKISDSAVTAAKIADATITAAKIASGVITPFSQVRQTVQGGPIDGSGLPNFLTSSGLVLTTQNLTNSPLVISASQGFGQGAERIASSSTDGAHTWTATASNTNYLYVDVAADGTFTTGCTTTAPVYSWTATSGANTFNMTTMTMYTSGSTKGWRVFIGECVAGVASISGITLYAYNGRFVKTDIATTYNTVTTFNHNIGAPAQVAAKLRCVTTEYGWSAGAIVEPFPVTNQYGGRAGINNYLTGVISTSATGAGYVDHVPKANAAGSVAITVANWNYALYVSRLF